MTRPSRSSPPPLAPYLLSAALILGLALAAASMAPPALDRLRRHLAASLTATLGLETRLGGFRLSLTGPRLTLEEVDLLAPGDPVPQIHLRRLHLDLDLWASLRQGSPQVTGITLEGSRLRLERDKDGRLSLADLPGGADLGAGPALGVFLARGRLRLQDGEIEWRDQGAQAQPLVLSEVRIDFDNAGADHLIHLQARLAADPATRLRLTAHLQGEAASPGDWAGQVHLQWRGGDLGPLTAGRLPASLRITSEHVALDSWHRVQDSRLMDGLARLEVQGLDIQGLIPGQGPSRLAARRITLELALDPASGRILTRGEGVRLELPWLLGDRPPIQVERLNGPLTWQGDGAGGTRLAAEALEAVNPDLRLRLRFDLHLPAHPTEAGPELDLQAEILNANAAVIRDYLPDAKLKPRLRDWLERAFPAGRIPMGLVLFRGPLAAFPFRQDEGQFHCLLGVEAMGLNFHPDWPPLEGFDGFVHFHNQAMNIVTTGGGILGFPLLAVQARIPDLGAARSIQVRGQALGDFAQGLFFLQETPLKRRLGAIPGLFTAEGQVQVDLDLDIPLAKGHPENQLRLAGTLSWPGAAGLTLAGADLVLRDLRGVLSFNQMGVTASRLEAQFLGAPLTLDLDRGQDDASGTGLTRLKLNAVTTVGTLAGQLPSPLWRHLEGEIPWEMDIRVPAPPPDAGARALKADFSLSSNLLGLAVKLPPPAGKARGATRSLSLNWQLQTDADTPLRGRYGDLALNLLFTRDDQGGQRLKRGTLALGQGQADPPTGDGLRLTGRIPELDLNPWLDWAHGLTGTGLTGGPRLTAADLRIDLLRLGQSRLRQVRLNLEQGAKEWDIQVEASELAGRLRIPHQARAEPLRLELERLDLKPLLGDDMEPEPARPAPLKQEPGTADPRQAHALDLAVERLLWSDNDLGRFTLRAVPTATGLAIDTIRLDGPTHLDLTGSGAWTRDGAASRTRLDFEASTGDLGQLLRHLDYASPLELAPAKAGAWLSWPGGPGDLALATLSGEVEVEIGKGSLLEVEPGVGRVLGVFNLGALGRRLTLDFTDLFDRGFVFEGIKGTMGIRDGWVETLDPLVMEGSSAEVRIEGRANLIDQTLDQVATITPSLGGGVALASAIAAGPLVGAAVFLADKASGGALDKIGRHAYDIRGPWANPDIAPRPRQDQSREAESPFRAPGTAEPRVSAEAEAEAEAQVEAPRVDPGPVKAGAPAAETNFFLDQP